MKMIESLILLALIVILIVHINPVKAGKTARTIKNNFDKAYEAYKDSSNTKESDK